MQKVRIHVRRWRIQTLHRAWKDGGEGHKQSQRMIKGIEATVRIENVREFRDVVVQALIPEVGDLPTSRSRVHLTTRESDVVLKILAKDVSALRATLSSYLHWIASIIDVCKVTEGLK